MQIEITGRHVDVTDAIKEYARRKIQAALGEIKVVESVHVILDIQKFNQIAEVVVQGKHHMHLDAKEVSRDLYASIDLVSDKIEKQVRRVHDKIVTTHHTGPKLGELEAGKAEAE
jgi:putative sigma-54 modulation protein